MAEIPNASPARRQIGHGFELDLVGERLCRGPQTIALRPKSWLVLRYFSERPGELVPIEDMLNAAWPGTAVTTAERLALCAGNSRLVFSARYGLAARSPVRIV